MDGALYVADYPSMGERLLIDRATRALPRWSRSRQELFYVQGERLMALPWEVREGGFHAGAAVTLFELGRLLPFFDVAPDGRFLFLQAPATEPTRDVIRVDLDGFGLLRPDAAEEPPP